VVDPRNSKYWDKELEGGLPDSRLSGSKREHTAVHMQARGIMRGKMWMEKVFCANCGDEGGLITPEWAAHIFYICWPCAERLGPPPGLVEVSEEVIKDVTA
jgi:hypothetical protein